ncbi:GNAT family N-acetyltransferase [Propioniciclava coleopterorum]|uniref:GNAT family N-acetyltransferase n=1 Tax=Propioniciclava coleopterorum TaxID=2714937 RepID=A0A6G7Y6M6_9ACTN|nr:GNAT family N-acetyltransferase [Propioniciclava coleopterorum]QIK72465.1 GNAT family N-acetyltransferase [Propioniciclava coleopterorum]
MEILAELDGATIIRATREHIPTIERLLADDPTSPQHVATTTLISDEVLGPTPGDSDLEAAFERIDSDPNQSLLVILDDSDRIIGTLQLSFVTTMARGGGIRAFCSGARIRAGADSIAIGKEVFAWMVGYAKSRGARVLMVTTDKDRAHIHGFFTTMGFRATHDALTLPLCPSK